MFNSSKRCAGIPYGGRRYAFPPYAGYADWRITFRFEGEDAVDVNLEDYH